MVNPVSANSAQAINTQSKPVKEQGPKATSQNTQNLGAAASPATAKPVGPIVSEKAPPAPQPAQQQSPSPGQSPKLDVRA